MEVEWQWEEEADVWSAATFRKGKVVDGHLRSEWRYRDPTFPHREKSVRHDRVLLALAPCTSGAAAGPLAGYHAHHDARKGLVRKAVGPHCRGHGREGGQKNAAITKKAAATKKTQLKLARAARR